MNYLPAPKTLLPFSKQHFRRGVAPSESVGKTWDCTRRWLTIRGRQTLHGPLLLVHFRQNRNAARCSGSPGGARIWASSLVTSLSGRWMTTLNSAEHRQSGLDFLVCDQKSTCSGTAPYAGIYQGSHLDCSPPQDRPLWRRYRNAAFRYPFNRIVLNIYPVGRHPMRSTATAESGAPLLPARHAGSSSALQLGGQATRRHGAYSVFGRCRHHPSGRVHPKTSAPACNWCLAGLSR